MARVPSTVSGFATFPSTYSSQATHVIYGKAHSSKPPKGNGSKTALDSLPSERTLFLVNVPPDATERELILFFKPFGLIEKVVFDQRVAEEEALKAINQLESSDEENSEEDTQGDAEQTAKKRKKKGVEPEKRPEIQYIPDNPVRPLRTSGRTAFLVFLDASSLTSALSQPAKARPWPNSSEPRGLAHYRHRHAAARPPLDAIRAYAESVIAGFDFDEAQRKRASQYKKGEAIVDDDGFTLVTRGGAYGQTVGGGVGVASKRFQQTGETSESAKARKKKAAASKEGLYGFQRHEKKRQELIGLKRKWQDDLDKVQKLKESKRYKPY